MYNNLKPDTMYEFILNHLWEAWTVVALLFLAAEVAAGDFFMTCFAVGAALSAIAALCGAGLYVTIGVFAMCSLLCIFFVRPFVLKCLHSRRGERKSNADALIGRRAVVREAIPAGGAGYVAIDGDMWRSVSADGSGIPEGTAVEVVSRESIILTVKPLN